MWQTKYAAAISKNLGLGLSFGLCSEGYVFPLWASVVRGTMYATLITCKGLQKKK